jgi:hypothetical protein
VNTLGWGPLDLIADTEFNLYDTYESVSEEFVLELLNSLTNASDYTDTGVGFALDENNSLSNSALIEGWALLNERYGYLSSNNADLSGGSIYPLRTMIDPESDNVLILDEGSDTGIEEERSEERETGSGAQQGQDAGREGGEIILDEGSDTGTEEEGSEEQETNSDAQQGQDVGSEGGEITLDEGSDSGTGEGEESQDDNNQGDGNTDDSERTDEEENEDQAAIEETTTEAGVIQAIAGAAAGWSVMGTLSSTARNTSRLDLSSAEEINAKRKYIRWDDLSF